MAHEAKNSRLEEDLPRIIREKREQRSKERQDADQWESDWESVRDTIITPRLKSAASILRSELGVVADAQRSDGGIDLIVANWTLSFNKDADKREVACSSSAAPEINENWKKIEALTESEVDRKIREFVKAIA